MDYQDIVLYNLEKIESDIGRIEEPIIREWKELEKKGKQIVVVSYKNISYMVGLLQAIGCLNPIIIAENGGCIQIGLNNPPVLFLNMIPTEEEQEELEKIKEIFLQKKFKIWFMETEVILGIYLANLKEQEEFNKCISDIERKLNNVCIHRIQDSIYIIPKSVTVQKALSSIFQRSEYFYKIYPEIPWKELNNKRILIIGASGMIGSTLIRALMEYNREEDGKIQVVGLSRNKETAKEQLKDVMDALGFSYISADINTPLEDMGSFDYMIHCASNTHPRQYSTEPIGTIMTNVLGTKNLLDYAAKYGVGRFVFLSSVEIYGENRGDVDVFAEDYLGYIDCNTLRSGYPEGKRLGESMCNAYAKEKGIDFVIPRLSRTYGPALLGTDSKAISQFIHKAALGEDIVLKSKGNQVFSYTYSEDAAAAVLFIMLKGISGEAYNVSDKESAITLADLAQILADIGGTKVIFELPDEVEKAGYSTATKAVLDAAKLENLGWSARVHMREGLKRTVDSLK